MPTIHKPQLDHASFPWDERPNEFQKELEAQRSQILELSGFNKEFGDPADAPSNNTERQGTELIRELTGILSLAATIKMDAGYKPANKLIATLKSIERDPSLIFAGGVEPEALAMVARRYRRGEERPGTFWFDVDRLDDAPLPDLQRVSKAASAVIRNLEKAAHSGRPRDVMQNYLADRLLACFLRFNETATRHSIASDGDRAQAAAGPFLDFLTVTLAPLNKLFAQLLPKYGARVISAQELARRALRNHAEQLGESKSAHLSTARSELPDFPHN